MRGTSPFPASLPAPADGRPGPSRSQCTIKSSDVTPSMQARIVEKAVEVIALHRSRTEMAKEMKAYADGLWGPTWHCFIGSSFGCQVKYRKGYYIFFQIGNLYCCLFRSPSFGMKKHAIVVPPAPSSFPAPPDCQVLISKMAEEPQQLAINIAYQASTQSTSYVQMSVTLKQAFDAYYGTGWVAMFGLRNTGTFVTRDSVDYICFNLGQTRVLLFRHHDADVARDFSLKSAAQYYVSVLSTLGTFLRWLLVTLVLVQLGLIIGISLLYPFFFCLMGLIHVAGFYATYKGIPELSIRYSICILIAATGVLLTHLRFEDKCEDDGGGQESYCRHAEAFHALVYAAYAMHACAFATAIWYAREVRRCIADVANTQLRPLIR